MFGASNLRGERSNALLGWSLTALVALAGVRDLLVGELVWGGFWLLVAAALALPAAVTRDPTVLVPWLLPLFAAAAVALQVVGAYTELAAYVAVTTAALVVVIELDAFTAVDMSRRFAVGFAAMTTLAVQAWLTVAQFLSDWWFGSDYLGSQSEVQWDIVLVAVVALVVSGAFVRFTAHVDSAGTDAQPLHFDESP